MGPKTSNARSFSHSMKASNTIFYRIFQYHGIFSIVSQISNGRFPAERHPVFRYLSISPCVLFMHPVTDVTDVFRCRGKVHAAYLLLRPAPADPWERAATPFRHFSHGMDKRETVGGYDGDIPIPMGYIMVI